jgi:uncharacterized protein YdhG (YjbR/CyaY superfamily)
VGVLVTGDGKALGVEVQEYLDAAPAQRRALFDRVDRLVQEAHPDARIVLSYRMPTYVVGRFRLYVGVWKHGLSFYGWERGRDAGLSDHHPDLVTSKGTFKLSPAAAARISDDELRDFVRAALQD